ncbi:epoxide hydrolase [Catenulispora sp. NL8]|uniref:Epoxide hydrolase n=1 Tax=Catenulispora pinistramenti TaxID=2705254 RepID=A0ABS5KTJ9_9ACTN|nr:epoxide hydrolase family protein [Catenulispora pinistramenti]MBS2549365.1 epoxide hydrolase [Catenulispora pinistramenti]
MRVTPFTVSVPDAVLNDLRERIGRTRWPDPAPGKAWSQGVDVEYLRELLAYWADGYDWRTAERELNRYRHFTAEIDGARIHFVHHRGTGDRIPLILTHGWPSTFTELLGLVDRLGDRFDLVVPSLPGYAFSQRPPHAGVDRRHVAGMWHQLMQGLGYERYGAGGSDFGSGIATHMALLEPARVIGIHLSTPELTPYTGPDTPPLTPEEQAYLAQVERWDSTERGYSAVQSTRPQTLGYALNDSPAGLAAWVLDKWRSWSASNGDLDAAFHRDALLTMLTIWWVTESITTSMRDYYDNRWHGSPIGPQDRVRVPTAMAVFANEFVSEGQVPRSWYERLYQVQRWTTFPRGGHFAAMEVPDVLAADIGEFFEGLR